MRPAAAFLEPDRRWNGLINAVSTYVSGAELDRVSVHDFERYDDSGVNWRVVEGYGAAIVAHAADLPVVLDCRCCGSTMAGARLQDRDREGRDRGRRRHRHAAERAPGGGDAALRSAAAGEDGGGRGPAARPRRQSCFFRWTGPEEFEKDSRLFGRTDRAGTGTYHFRPFGRPMIEAYFGGRLAAALEEAGEAAFFDFAAGELVGAARQRFPRDASSRCRSSLGRRPVFARLLFLCAAGPRGLPRRARGAGRRSAVLRRRGLLAGVSRPRTAPISPASRQPSRRSRRGGLTGAIPVNSSSCRTVRRASGVT